MSFITKQELQHHFQAKHTPKQNDYCNITTTFSCSICGSILSIVDLQEIIEHHCWNDPVTLTTPNINYCDDYDIGSWDLLQLDNLTDI